MCTYHGSQVAREPPPPPPTRLRTVCAHKSGNVCSQRSLTQLLQDMQRALTSFYSIEPRQCTDENPESPEQCLPPPAKSQCSSSRVSQPSECSSINLASWDIAEFACGNQVAKTPIEKLDALIHIYRPPESF